MRGRAVASCVAAVMAAWPASVAAQELVAAAADTVAVTRHLLAFDLTRLRPFVREYDMYVMRGDTLHHIGVRTVTLAEMQTPDSPAGWLLTESRTGVVAGGDTVMLAADLRPVSWTGTVGRARLVLTFLNDSVHGSATFERSSAKVSEEAPPDLVASAAMLDLLVGVAPLDSAWADSVHVLVADLEGASVVPAEFAVIGQEPLGPDPLFGVAWLVSLRADLRSVQLKVDAASGAVLRLQQSVPAHVGTFMEYRLRIPFFFPP